MPKRQSKRGGGLLDFLSSDPSKKIKANNDKIAELKKDSDIKCKAVQVANDDKIKKLEDANVVLQKQIDDKPPVDETSNPSMFSRFSGLFSSDAKPVTKPVDEPVTKPVAEPVAAKPVTEDQNASSGLFGQNNDEQKEIGDRKFGGRKKSKRNQKKSRVRKSIKK
jgi:hypothetical protein